MSTPTSNAPDVLADQALGAPGTVAWQDDEHQRFRAVVSDVLDFAADLYFARPYSLVWTNHLEYLIEIESAIKEEESIEAAGTQLCAGIMQMSRLIQQSSRRIEPLPLHPPGGLALILLVSIVQADPTRRAAFNTSIDEWENAAHIAAQLSSDLLATARQLHVTTQDEIERIRRLVKEKQFEHPLGPTLRNRFLLRLDIISDEIEGFLASVVMAERTYTHAAASLRASQMVDPLQPPAAQASQHP